MMLYVKTSTSVFYFVSSQMFEDDKLKLLLIPNNFKMSAVKTYNYFKYSSFLRSFFSFRAH